jgi:hypothetical protein
MLMKRGALPKVCGIGKVWLGTLVVGTQFESKQSLPFAPQNVSPKLMGCDHPTEPNDNKQIVTMQGSLNMSISRFYRNHLPSSRSKATLRN